MHSWRIPLVSAALSLGLAGCSLPTEPPAEIAPEKNRVEVERSLYSHTVAFEEGESGISPDARWEFERFLRETGADRSATIVVTAARTYPGELSDQRRHAVERLLREKGFRPSPQDELLDPHPEADADVLVRVARYHVVLPECPDYSRAIIGGYHNLPSSNFGCADQRNLGLMVANPRDLLRGRDLGPADGERQGRAVRAYRDGEIPVITGDSDRHSFAGDN